mmetsp:Transcript_44737/g.109794  ORF Transcript_44737/g.109794 Transcript_44737/m.109794 type:complete len:391 (+) Transcript_44737:72-1244(+)|eukprot:CAMPEP_0198314286 /NCGR_PEP_ID=MMETSP1450-20131203/4985_1 /TAXON_ID=753684 ORGANISM="Madagascaria erythrocladiodes, Strain CCMP3234" /NCGR_SAMPLE_ID=MMETSP1450 /ASSEMBLY_ACC=CAM_ASM_001115 /LENGTH=390 /DNA_ID=CAMNT_0044017329 /DNA_START=49 /DNA_END=1221 /DNA_ORIENTATION=-
MKRAADDAAPANGAPVRVTEYHGGQEWRHMSNFVCDFSVTTNYLGTPDHSIQEAAKATVAEAHHYPASNFEPALTKLTDFVKEGVSGDDAMKQRMMLGNGLSELIDLITRWAPDGSWRSAPYYAFGGTPLQYMEYERSARAHGRKILTSAEKDEKEAMSVIINPSNPTGDWMTLDKLKSHIEATASNNTAVLVDESMLMWHSPAWRQHSLVSEREWVTKMLKEKNISVFVLHSWTKIFCCCGIRVGSALCPSEEIYTAIKAKQVPWSLNTAALRFLELCFDEDAYLKKTWDTTTELRARTEKLVKQYFPNWTITGEPWLSWLWIDTHDEALAAKVVEVSKAAGTPVRWGRHGYAVPTYIRIAVREAEHQDVLFNALATLSATGGAAGGSA